MKRLLATLTLIFVLSFPVFGGHTQVGGGRECSPCGDVTCFCDPGESPYGNAAANQNNNPADVVSALGLAFVAVLLVLRTRA